MSAIELMDPKMDAGMLENQSKSKIKSFKQAIENNLVKVDNITFEDKIAIVDNTLSNLVTWLDGASLAQSLFSNLYLHDPSLIEDNYIKTFSIAILKITDWMRNKITSASVYEEEDFQPMTYNFKFCQDIADNVALANLKATEDAAAKTYRHLKAETKPDQSNEEVKTQTDLAHGLWMRIKFIRGLYQIMQNSSEHVAFSKNSEEILKHINNCLEALAKVKETHSLGSPPIFIKAGKTTYPVVMGFEPSVNQRLLPPTFPRFIRIQSFDSTVNIFTELLNELKNSFSALEANTFHSLFEFSLKFSNKNQSVLLRSMLQLVVLPRVPLDKLLKMKLFLKETIQKFIAPPVLQPKCVLYNQEISVQLVDNFLNKCSPVFTNLLQILGHNKARQREKLGQILEDFANLQEEADNVDRILHSCLAQQKSPLNHLACLGSWLLYNSLTVMHLYLLLGFELELYSRFEYHYIYWYICEIVLNWQINTLTRTENSLSLSEQLFSTTKTNKKPKKKSKSFYEKEIAILTASRHMHSAYYQTMRAFKLQNHIKSPQEEFDCEEYRYTHRFNPFHSFNTPAICLYHQYREKDDHFINSYPVEKIYSFAQDHFDLARSAYEKHSDVPMSSVCSKIAKNNFVVMRLLSSGLKKVENLELDFSEHPHFPIIRI